MVFNVLLPCKADYYLRFSNFSIDPEIELLDFSFSFTTSPCFYVIELFII